MAPTIDVTAAGWPRIHLEHYLKTDGAEGHVVDFSPYGGSTTTPCLILKTIGRQSGAVQMVPLIYGEDAGRFVIVASKGGAPKHPAWFLNLQANPEIGFQVADRKYRGTARIAAGPERARLYAMMAGIYPPYIEYSAKTEREIPVVLLEPQGEVEKL